MRHINQMITHASNIYNMNQITRKHVEKRRWGRKRGEQRTGEDTHEKTDASPAALPWLKRIVYFALIDGSTKKKGNERRWKGSNEEAKNQRLLVNNMKCSNGLLPRRRNGKITPKVGRGNRKNSLQWIIDQPEQEQGRVKEARRKTETRRMDLPHYLNRRGGAGISLFFNCIHRRPTKRAEKGEATMKTKTNRTRKERIALTEEERKQVSG